MITKNTKNVNTKETTTTKARIAVAEIEYFERMLEAGVDNLLWEVPGGLMRITRDDLPAIRRFLDGKAESLHFSGVWTGDEDAATEGGHR